MMPVWANFCILYGLVEFGNRTRDAQNGNEELAGNVYAPIAEDFRQLNYKGRNPSLKSLSRGVFMAEGKYESGSTVGTAITFLLIGLGAGTVIGMLLAPKPGRQMRRDLRRGYDSARETFDDWKENAKDFAEEVMERGSDFADDVRDRVTPVVKAARRR
jgi:gas vesicle protein